MDRRNPSQPSQPPAAERASPGLARLRRRLVTIPAIGLALALHLAFAPLTLALALIVDLVRRRRFVALRLWAFVGCYLAVNVFGQVLLAGVWLASGFGRTRAWLVRWTYAVQALWVWLLFRAATRLWQLRWTVGGSECIAPAPIVMLTCHASVLDTLIPSVFVTRAQGIPLRFVLKRELLVDPCLDIAGHWLPNHFVDREPSDSRIEIEAIERLAAELAPGEGLLIYPEGTRFTPGKRARILAGLAERSPALHRRAAALTHTLLPRAGGSLALLRRAPEADVVICGHEGLRGFATIGDMWSGELIGRTIHVQFWRYAAASLPADDEARAEWIYDRWAELDRWVASRGSQTGQIGVEETR
ncbi:1-acyl-sn-glycerol-3-phosphate acyltransferase [Nannocystaceae bacterium ST9]